MNCKPNELAVIVKPSHHGPLLGMVVKTLYVAPDGNFRLPDGFKQFAVQPSKYSTWWVVEFPRLIDAPCSYGTRKTFFACVPDAVLRPIRDPGEEARDETLQWLPVPSTDEVLA